MKETQHIVHCQEVLFSLNFPFQPYTHQMMYIETFFNERINSYFRKNIKRVINIFGERFIYLPALMEDITPIVEYNWPETDPIRIEEAKPDSSWYLDTYQEIISYRINKANGESELSLDILESPLLMRYEYPTEAGQLFTLFPLQYENEEQFEQLLIDIEQMRDQDLKLFHSTIVESAPHEDPRDRADYDDVDRLTEEIKQRINKLRLMGISDYAIKKLLDLPKPKLSHLRITKDYRIFLPDYNNMEITMPTLSKVVFLFYLRHPEGLRFKELTDHREELLEIYYRISNRGEIEKLEQSIDELVDSTRNSINEKCSRIRAAFVSQFAQDIAINYCITGWHSQPKRIILDRSLVVDEAGILIKKK